MENLEKEYRNRFRKQLIDVESSDSEAIWDAISEELPQASNAHNGTIKYHIGQIADVCALLLFVFCMSIGSDHGKQDESKASFDHPGHWPNETTTGGKHEASVILGKSQENSVWEDGNDQNQPGYFYARSETYFLNQSDNHSGLEMDGAKDFIKEPHSTSTITEHPIQFTGETSISLDNKANDLEPLPLLPARDVFNYSPQFRQVQKLMLSTLDKKSSKKPKDISISIGIECGANNTNLGFVSQQYREAASIKNTAEVSNWGSNAALRFGLLWKKRWSLGTGIDYRQSWTAFNYVQMDTLSILKTNQLLRVSINTVNGDTLQKFFGDTIVNALSTRRIHYNNSFRQIGIPIDIGMRWDIGKWRIGGDIGAVLNMIVYQGRKGLDEQINIRSTADKPALNIASQIGVGVRVSPAIGYRLGDRWALEIRPQWSWQQMQDPMSIDMQMHIHQFSMLAGIHYLIK